MKILKAIGIIVLLLALYQAAQLFIMLVAGVIYIVGQIMTTAVSGAQPGLEELISDMITYLTAQTPWVVLLAVVITLPTYYLIYRNRRQELGTFISVRGIGPLSVPILVIFGLSVSFILDLALGILSQLDFFSRVFSDYEQVSSMIFGGGFVLTLLSVGIVAPIFEELLFRGLVFGELRKITPVRVALVLQALLFGVYHMNVVQGVYAFLLGLLIGYIYYRSNSIIAPIIIHVSINSLSVIINEFITAEQLTEWGFVLAIACVVLFFLTGVFILTSKTFRRTMDNSLVRAGRPEEKLQQGGGPGES